ncbi:MAG: alpha/beta hydrolase [Alphaproteobacteria bacterium]|nr:alpha/beta hydrolase [Alphaproteobacteria bacterium]
MALSPASVLNVIALWGRYQATTDIAYAAGPRHTLDVYRPTAPAAQAPVAVFFYGGNWQEGDKAIYRFVGAALAAKGILTVIPDYRVYPEVRFPSFLEDGADAVRWTYDHAGEFGGDPHRIVLMGHSAGAHIAAMLAYDAQWLAAVRLNPDRDVRGLVGLAGPYDFLPLHSATLKIIFGPEAQLAVTQPINFVEPGAPPAFLVSGRADDIVDPGNVTRIAKRIAEKGGTVTTKFYDDVGHRTLIGAFSPPLRPLAPVLRDTVQFVAGVTGASPAPPAAAPVAATAPR